MQFTNINIAGVLLLTPKVFCDNRGYLFESFSQRELDKAVGRNLKFVVNTEYCQSMGSSKNFDTEGYHLIECIKGAVEVILTDQRTGSLTYGQSIVYCLDDQNKQQFFVSEGVRLHFTIATHDAIVLVKSSKEPQKS